MDSKINLNKYYSNFQENFLDHVIKESTKNINDQKKKKQNSDFIKKIYFNKFVDIKWNEITKLKKSDFINKAIINTKIKDPNYLEIGSFRNQNFDLIKTKNKISVDPDPNAGAKFLGTSDDFFFQNNKKFDVIFIDGLHHYDQCHKDAINSFNCLNKNGYLFFHDLVPRNFFEEYIPQSSPVWTGDVWKVSIELAKTKGIVFKVILAYHGLGMLKKIEENIDFYTDDKKKLQNLRFKDFMELNEVVNYEKAEFAYENFI